MMGTKVRQFGALDSVTLEDLVPKDHFYRHVECTHLVNTFWLYATLRDRNQKLLKQESVQWTHGSSKADEKTDYQCLRLPTSIPQALGTYLMIVAGKPSSARLPSGSSFLSWPTSHAEHRLLNDAAMQHCELHGDLERVDITSNGDCLGPTPRAGR